jgi:hypothetical protein
MLMKKTDRDVRAAKEESLYSVMVDTDEDMRREVF